MHISKLSEEFPGIDLSAIDPNQHTHLYVVKAPARSPSTDLSGKGAFRAIAGSIPEGSENSAIERAEEQMDHLSVQLVGVYRLSSFDFA